MKNLIKVVLLTTFLSFLVQYVCTAQEIPNIKWDYRIKGDSVISVKQGEISNDTLFSRTGKMIFVVNDTIQIVSDADAIVPEFTPISIMELDANGNFRRHYYSRMDRINKTNRNLMIVENTKDVMWYFAIDQNGAIGTSNDTTLKNIRNHGWVKTPYFDITQSYLTHKIQYIPNLSTFGKFPIINADSASYVVPPFQRTIDFMVFTAGTTTTSEGLQPHVGVHDLRPSVKTSSTTLLPALTSSFFAPISYGYHSQSSQHILLVGNKTDSFPNNYGFEILFVDTTLVENKRMYISPTEVGSPDGVIVPKYIYPQQNQIVVVGFVVEDARKYPFVSIHSLDGTVLKSKNIKTISEIHSGNVSTDGSQIALCGFVLDSKRGRDFYLLHLNAETLNHSEYVWGSDTVENELFDITFSSKDTMYVTGGEDKDFYAAKIVIDPTTSVENQIESKNVVEISPNPATSMCTITARNLRPIHSSMTIQNMQGQTVATVFEGIPATTEVQNISIEHLPTGAYFVTVQNGHTIQKTKFVIQR